MLPDTISFRFREQKILNLPIYQEIMWKMITYKSQQNMHLIRLNNFVCNWLMKRWYICKQTVISLIIEEIPPKNLNWLLKEQLN